MIYFDEMNDKYGFADGSAIPREAEACRTVYVRVLNVLLERLGSACRIVSFNRSGCHNWCLWIRVPVETYNQIVSETKPGSDPDGSGFSGDEIEPDDAWRQAVETANQMGLDDCIEVRVQIDDSALNETLEFAKTGQLPELVVNLNDSKTWNSKFWAEGTCWDHGGNLNPETTDICPECKRISGE